MRWCDVMSIFAWMVKMNVGRRRCREVCRLVNCECAVVGVVEDSSDEGTTAHHLPPHKTTLPGVKKTSAQHQSGSYLIFLFPTIP